MLPMWCLLVFILVALLPAKTCMLFCSWQAAEPCGMACMDKLMELIRCDRKNL